MRKLSDFSVLLLSAALTLCGFALLPGIPLQLSPEDRQAQTFIRVRYPGATPLQCERELTRSLEAAVAALPGIESLRSSSAYGMAQLRVSFKKGSDAALREQELRAVLRQVAPLLPPEAGAPEIQHSDPESGEQGYFLQYAVATQLPLDQADALLRKLMALHLGLVPGLAEIELSGSRPRWLEVRVAEGELARSGLGFADIDATLGALNTERELLPLTQEGLSRSVVLRTPRVSVDSLAQTALGMQAGRLIRLGDVAEAALREAPAESYSRINGRESMILRFRAMPDANLLRVADLLYKRMEALAAELPAGTTVLKVADETDFLREHIATNLRRTLLALAAVLGTALLLSFSLRYALILLLSMLANLAIAFILCRITGVSLHLYALAAFSVSFGLMADAAVLMADGLRHGRSPGSLWLPLFAGGLTTLAALSAIVFLPEKLQHNLGDFCFTVGACVGASLLTAWLLLPALCRQLGWTGDGRAAAPAAGKTFWYRVYRWLYPRRRWAWALLLWAFGLPVFLLPEKWNDTHLAARLYNRSLGAEAFVKHVRPWTDQLLGGASRLFYLYVYDKYAYGEPQQTVLYVQATMPSGTPLVRMDELMQRVESLLSEQMQYISRYDTEVFNGEEAQIEVRFTDAGEAAGGHFRVKSLVESFAADVSGATWIIYGVGNGFNNLPGEPPRYSLLLRGYNFQEMERLAVLIGDSLQRHPRVKELDLQDHLSWRRQNLDVFRMSLRDTALAFRGIGAGDIAGALAYAAQGAPSRQVNLQTGPDAQCSYSLWLRRRDERELYAIWRQPMLVDSQQVAPAAFARLKRERAEQQVLRINQQYIRRISFVYNGSPFFGDKYINKTLALWAKGLPNGYSLEESKYSGFYIPAKERKRYQGLALLLIAGLIFYICAALFESLRYGLLILLVIPFSYLGLFLTHYLFGIGVDQGTFASYVLLAGLSVNNSLLLFYAIRQLKTRSLTALLAVMREKRNPIVLSVLSTCAGMAPILFERSQPAFWYALAWGSTGGLIVSTLLLYAFTPLLFKGVDTDA